MDLDAKYYCCIERITREMVSPDQIQADKLYPDLQELCRLLRVAKGVTTFYNSLAMERRGEGESYTPFDSGAETDQVLTVRGELGGMMVGQCSVYHEKGTPPWTETERVRIDTVQRMMLNFVSKDRMAMLIRKATLFDDAGFSNIRLFTGTVEKIGSEQGLSQFGMARFDLKHFSLINQQLGRELSDEVMKNYIGLLEEAAGECGIVSRLGGDNFVILFRKENLDAVIKIFEGAPVRYGRDDDGRVMVSVNAGVLVIPEDFYYHDFGDLMDRIINAYSVAKTGIRGDIVFSSDEMLQQKEHAMRIKQLFPVAMQNDEILVFYQPKINITTDAVVGAEALSRWYHSGKLIMPMEFIPVLEQSMDICKLDFYVLDHVCRDIRRWMDEGKPVVRISVNLSRRHLIDLDLLDHILSIIDRHRVPHHFIEIELTETTTDVEFKDLKRIVTGLQEAGVYTSVDDFGIGYSSLNLIREIPWNILKVDKNFLPLSEQATQNRQNIMFHHVVNMAKEIGLICVAEGVETGEQVEILRKNGCDIAQGFYYDKPLPVREFERRLDRQYYESL
ncbi:MAG: GGDEF domain-containing protein [Clostridia bacterium]|nr:GGDEF domain-containing protein [Clostridia bacterium]